MRAHVVGFDLDGNLVEFDATGWFARCMQHEYDHLNGTLYVDRLDDRQAKKARKAVKRNGWGKPGTLAARGRRGPLRPRRRRGQRARRRPLGELAG